MNKEEKVYCSKCGAEMEYTPTLGYNCTTKECINEFWADIKREHNKSSYEDLEKENKRMRNALDKIRDIELEELDIDWDEYEAECSTTDISPIINYCEIGLGEQEE